MKLKKIREESNYYTQKTSEAIQALSFSGIAILWLFKITSGEKFQFSLFLFIAFISFVICVLVGIIQYFIQYIVWGSYYNKNYEQLKESCPDPDEQVIDMPEKLSLLILFLFFTKLITLFVGYIIMFIDVYNLIIIK